MAKIYGALHTCISKLPKDQLRQSRALEASEADIILLTPPPFLNGSHPWTLKTQREEIPLVWGFKCLELCLYGIRELPSQHHDPNQSEHSLWLDLDQWECSTVTQGELFTLECAARCTAWCSGGPGRPGAGTPGTSWWWGPTSPLSTPGRTAAAPQTSSELSHSRGHTWGGQISSSSSRLISFFTGSALVTAVRQSSGCWKIKLISSVSLTGKTVVRTRGQRFI